MSEKDMDLLVQREYSKRILKGKFLLWRKIRILRNIMDMVKNNFDELRKIDELKNMPKLVELNERYQKLNNRYNELFDIATDYKFSRKIISND